MPEGTAPDPPVELTRIIIEGLSSLVVAAPVGEVTTWMLEGGVYRARFVYWQDVEDADYDFDRPAYYEQPGALRADKIIHAETPGPAWMRQIHRARQAQNTKD